HVGNVGGFPTSDTYMSSDGRYVAFLSISQLVDSDVDSLHDAYVRDRVAHKTFIASVSTSGQAGNDTTEFTVNISRDGRYVAFDSAASNLVPGDDNGTYDVFVRDTEEGTTVLVSKSTYGTIGDDISQGEAIAPNLVVFSSGAT